MTSAPARQNIARVRQAGVSLIELLIAMALGLLVVGAVGYVFLGSKQTFRTQEGLARLQEDARFAFEIISQDLRMAGFAGCNRVNFATVYAAAPANLLADPTLWYGILTNSPLGYEATNAGAPAVGMPADLAGNGAAIGSSVDNDAINGRDALSIVRADERSQYVVAAHAAGSNSITTAAHGLGVGDVNKVVVVCDPSGVFSPPTVFSLGAVPNGTTLTANANIATAIPLNSRIFPVHAATYYVRNNAAGVPALYRQTLTAAGGLTAEELVPGVEDMQINYGVDTDATADGRPNQYQDADDVTNGTGATPVPGANARERWSRAHSVHISLLLRTPDDNVVPEAQTYTFNGANTLAGDRRLRKVFTHVIAVRNR